MSGPKPNPGILDITAYKGGEATVAGVERSFKLSSNENALGCSEAARTAAERALAEAHLYPDGSAAALRSALGERHGIDPARIVCGAGSDEILQLLAKAYLAPGDKALQSRHGFLVYKIATMAAGAQIVMAEETNLTADMDRMAALAADPDVKIVFLANPNNPTGTMVGRAALETFHKGLRSDQFLVLDGAYAEFLDDAEDDGAMDLAKAHDNIIVTRTFSKIYGLAALRVGWGYLPEAAAGVLNRVRGPFNVTTAGQAAALAALEDDDFVARSKDHNTRWRARVSDDLRALGYEVTPSFGNFVLVGFGFQTRAQEADAFLRARGLIVRAVAAYGLPDRLRVSIGAAEANERLIEAMDAFRDEETSAAAE